MRKTAETRTEKFSCNALAICRVERKNIMLVHPVLPLVFLTVFGSQFGEDRINQELEAVEKVVADQVGTDSLKEAMLLALNRHPKADRWSGADEKQIFGIGVVPFTDRDVKDGDVRMFRHTARLIAAKEMLFAKVLLDRYAESGLTDPGSLRQAVADANGSFGVRGRITYDMEETFIVDDRIVGIVVADRNGVEAVLADPDGIDAVRLAYGAVIHRQAKRLIADRKFEEALMILRELRQAKLLGREQLFDVLRCFIGMDKPVDAEKIVRNLVAGRSEDVDLLRRLAAVTAVGESGEFQRLTHRLLAEIDRLDPSEQDAERVLGQLLDELLESSPIP